jgi:hypothetical protein
MKLIASFITRRGIHQRIRVCQINSPWVPLNTASASRLRSVALFIILLLVLGQPFARLANMTYTIPEPLTPDCDLLRALSEALAIDLLTYWPSVIASW